jgi:hypothetical protein
VRAQQLVLLDHHALVADLLVAGGEPVVPDERHPLDQRLVAAHHAVEPPEVVVAPGVVRRERVAVLVARSGPDQLRRGRGVDHRVNGGADAGLHHPLDVAGPGAEAGAPQEALGVAVVGVGQRRRLGAGLGLGRRLGDAARWHDHRLVLVVAARLAVLLAGRGSVPRVRAVLAMALLEQGRRHGPATNFGPAREALIPRRAP